ncbi:MAG: alkane 1-monooxygenase [Flavobacteriales bacterium]|nr:alkane 1-monooxygenase [Flavobacteriales bacterium]
MLPYLCILLVPTLGFYSLVSTGWESYSLLLFAFGVVTFLDLIVGRRLQHRTAAEIQKLSAQYSFALLTYLMLPLQYLALWFFLRDIGAVDPGTQIGRILSMGVLCGVLGINVAHELGHKPGKWDQRIAQLLLLSSLYMHFFIEHNRGHHKDVGKPGEPGTARKNEGLYRFYFRAIPHVFLNAWNLEKSRLRRANESPWTLKNQFLRFQVIQIVFCLLILFNFGLSAFLSFLAAAFIGILLLEAINYIEHYGLVRQKMPNGIYENVKAEHSWNSDHWFSRMVLLELPLHPDHHLNGSRPYQALKSQEQAPQMPFGYSLMILTALIPPLWRSVVNERLDAR